MLDLNKIADGLVPFASFRTPRHHYIYDAPTNNIVRCSPVVAALAEDFYRAVPDTEIARRHPRFDSNEIETALAFLRGLQEHARVLVPQTPSRVVSAVDRDMVCNDRNSLFSLVLNVTEACNIRCSYCVYGGAYEAKRVHTNKKMSWEVAKRSIDYLVEHSKGSTFPDRMLGWYGGEPLMNFPLIKRTAAYFTEVFEGIPVRFNMTSNATFWNEQIMDFFAEYDVDLLVSLDGPKEVHDAYRVNAQGRGTFETVMRNLNALQARHPDYFERKVMLNAVVNPPLDLRVLDAFFSEFPIQVSISSVEPTEFEGEASAPSQAHGWEEMKAKFKKGCLDREFLDHGFKKRGYNFAYYLFIRDFEKIHRRRLLPGYGDEVASHGCCVPGQERIFVNAQGGFETCEKTEGSPLMKLGDVDQGADPIATLRIFDTFNDMGYAPCTRCFNTRFCSLCFAHAKDGDDFDARKRYWNCQSLRARTKEMLSLYCEILEEDPEALDFILTHLSE